jgi:hypothetical protein
VAYSVHPRGLFAEKIITVSADKPSYPGLAHWLSGDLRCKFLYHLSRRKQRLSCKVLNILYEGGLYYGLTSGT